MRYLVLVAGLAASGCGAEPEAIPGLWQIETLDGEAFAARAMVDMSEPGRISGKAPCNGFSGSREGTLAAFELGPLMATKMACPDLSDESRFFEQLGAMTSAVEEGGKLVLSDGAGGGMVFVPAPAE
ncbi:META domain-containing protein [Ponticoccus alexandrii]|uniref:META domain-containing protein n=1 Tax=Ponticoccus alexandrii TaxID=1943633 RepID=A0ABX7F4N4_9RHOB|nr:META domain-containing protein [Ponticoccus alexandrii]QRF65495.1 META domain-containing protein [Ponticoccus alexandrii]